MLVPRTVIFITSLIEFSISQKASDIIFYLQTFSDSLQLSQTCGLFKPFSPFKNGFRS